jgi:hypothetical protein
MCHRVLHDDWPNLTFFDMIWTAMLFLGFPCRFLYQPFSARFIFQALIMSKSFRNE